MICKACEERGQTWFGFAPICAFDNPGKKFNKDNWNCATMNKLRELCYCSFFDDTPHLEGTWSYRDDFDKASIGVIGIPENELCQGWLILTWYKDRGKTGGATIVNDDDENRELTLEIAEEIIKNFKVVQ